MLTAKDRILFVTPSAYPLGGVAVWLDYLIQGLSNEGAVCYVGLVDGQFHKANDYLQDHPFDNVIKISSKTKTQYGRVSAIKKAALDVEATIVVSINIPDVFEAVAQIKLSGKKVHAVMTLHALEATYFKDIELLKEQIDAIVVTNKLTQKMVGSYTSYETERIFYAPYGVDINEPVLIKEPSKPIVISFVGRLDQEQKRCLDLLEFVQHLDAIAMDFTLQIAGDGPCKEALLEKLSAFIETGKVVYLGKCSHHDLMTNIYPNSDALIVTSSWETGPIVIWEAMSLNVIVLSSRYIGSESEQALIDKQNCLLFDVGDVKEAARALASINEPQSIQLRKHARALVENRYSKTSSIESWKHVFECIDQSIQHKPANSKISEWPINGKIEQIFGHKCGDYVRKLFTKKAFSNSAGDEWPHTYSFSNEADTARFIEALNSIESQSK